MFRFKLKNRFPFTKGTFSGSGFLGSTQIYPQVMANRKVGNRDSMARWSQRCCIQPWGQAKSDSTQIWT